MAPGAQVARTPNASWAHRRKACMVGFFVLAIVATPFVFAGWLLNRIFQHRAQMQQIQASRHVALPPAGYAPVDPELEQRLRNLEAIVTSADYEFSERLREQRDPRAA